MEVPQKTKIDLLYNPAISLLRKHPKECKSRKNRVTSTPMLIAALFIIAKL
jgi:hypothetical protein